MDPVRTGHIRQFANAVSLILQGHSSRSDLDLQHLRGLLDAVARSYTVGQFISNPAPAHQQSHWKASTLVVVKAISATEPIAAASGLASRPVFAPVVAPQAHAKAAEEGSADKRNVNKSQAGAPSKLPRLAPLSLPAAQTISRAQLAGRFFVALPWAGRAPAIQADIPLPLPVAMSRQTPAVLASHFFAALPWISRGLAQSISIGSGSDDIEKARRLGVLTGRSESVSLVMPAYLKAPSDPGAATTAAFGFFRKLPWAGRSAAH